ncbi:MAG TPA: hypothetical protein VJJ23_01885 [Candidatus Nanoarchaeia archaeon]|nr:hypothetical protein [Candidatus Nanoarchaeia archaeon]
MRNRITKLATALTLTTTLLLSCDNSNVHKQQLNYNQLYGMINLAEGDGFTPALIVDENRDGSPDYIAEYTNSDKENILWLKEGYKPTIKKFVITEYTRIFKVPSETRDKAVTVLDSQRGLGFQLRNEENKKD